MPEAPYHHGDLPSALVASAIELLEANGAADLSLRAVARRAGVSAAAPYRHFPDRTALLSAVAAVGYRDLGRLLAEVSAEPADVDVLADMAVAYVRFALERPGLFRVMFTEGCDPTNEDRVSAVDALRSSVATTVERVLPGSDGPSVGTAMWALVHGLAFLHLDGKLDAASDEVVDATVAAAVHAVIGARTG